MTTLNLFDTKASLSDTPPIEIVSLIERGAIFMVNHSGGKDISDV